MINLMTVVAERKEEEEALVVTVAVVKVVVRRRNCSTKIKLVFVPSVTYSQTWTKDHID